MDVVKIKNVVIRSLNDRFWVYPMAAMGFYIRPSFVSGSSCGSLVDTSYITQTFIASTWTLVTVPLSQLRVNSKNNLCGFAIIVRFLLLVWISFIFIQD